MITRKQVVQLLMTAIYAGGLFAAVNVVGLNQDVRRLAAEESRLTVEPGGGEECGVKSGDKLMPCLIRVTFDTQGVERESVEETKIYMTKLIADAGVSPGEVQVFYGVEGEVPEAVVKTGLGREDAVGEKLLVRYQGLVTAYSRLKVPSNLGD